MKTQEQHKTVLLHEAVQGLALKPDSIVVDCTLGAGGHAKEILKTLSVEGSFIGFDADQIAIENLESELVSEAKISLQCLNFRNIATGVVNAGFSNVDAVVADLGWRTDQFLSKDQSGKGFSFMRNEPLVMTYGNPEDYTFTAFDVANEWEESSLSDIIYGYGEDRFSRRIARAIVEARNDGYISTSKQLADIVASAIPKRFQNRRINPATKTFQAIRMAVNDELGALSELLDEGYKLLNPGGRMAIITFHSLEDRVVKLSFRKLAQEGLVERITKKPIVPEREEVIENTRSRSAKLRIIEKV